MEVHIEIITYIHRMYEQTQAENREVPFLKTQRDKISNFSTPFRESQDKERFSWEKKIYTHGTVDFMLCFLSICWRFYYFKIWKCFFKQLTFVTFTWNYPTAFKGVSFHKFWRRREKMYAPRLIRLFGQSG